MILQGQYNHAALVKCGATYIKDMGDGTTYVEPNNLNISAYESNCVVCTNKVKADELKAQIAVLDLKRIRPLAEGDSAYVATLNAQIAALRAQLATL